MIRLIGLFLFLCLLSGPLSTAQPAFTRMDVFDLQWASDPQIAPDGKMIVYVRRHMDLMNDRRAGRLWLIRTDGTAHRKLTTMDVSESGPVWSPDGTRIAFIAGTDEGPEIFVYWLESGSMARISQLSGSPGSLSWSPDGTQIAFSQFVEESHEYLVQPPPKPRGAQWAEHPFLESRLKHEADGTGYLPAGYSHFFVIPAEGGPARQVTSGAAHHRGTPIWSADGQHLYFSGNLHENWAYDFRNSEIYRLTLANGRITALTDRNGPDEGVVVSPDGKTLAYTGFDDRVQTYQVNHIYLMDAGGTNQRLLETGLDRSVSGLQWAADGNGLYFLYDDRGNTRIGYTDLQGNTEEVAKDAGGTNPARPYGGGSFSISRQDQIVYPHTTPDHPAEIAVVQKGQDEPTLITGLSAPLLSQRTLGKVEEIWYQSSIDNRDIQGWIVKPPFFDPERTYPLLVENHGGPIANYGDRFSPEMQLYASHGFVVFYPNPRGSTSYGEAFGNLLYHNYPGDDYHDVMDGVEAVLERGYVSEDSLFVTGGSAGGIMTAWMIGKSNRFRAAAVIKPVMNWISKTLVADNYYGYAYSRYPGQPWENPDTYWDFSPVSLVGNIETPTLVMVGSRDLRTPLSEAKQLYHALKIRQIETGLVVVPGAFHFIANRPSQLITKIDHIVAWFDRYRK